jgi:hypothetical protein
MLIEKYLRNIENFDLYYTRIQQNSKKNREFSIVTKSQVMIEKLHIEKLDTTFHSI